MKINLNELGADQGDVKIFNEGTAGRVTNVSVSVLKKTPEDKDNAPDFKIVYTDANGGTVNDGVYYPKDGDAQNIVQIKTSRLVKLLHSLNPETKTKQLPEFDNYRDATEFLMKQIVANSKNGRVNIFVTYGTVGKPSKYLGLRLFDFVEPVGTNESETRLRVKMNPNPDKSQWNDNMTRVEETNIDIFSSNSQSNGQLESDEISVDAGVEDDLEWS